MKVNKLVLLVHDQKKIQQLQLQEQIQQQTEKTFSKFAQVMVQQLKGPATADRTTATAPLPLETQENIILALVSFALTEPITTRGMDLLEAIRASILAASAATQHYTALWLGHLWTLYTLLLYCVSTSQPIVMMFCLTMLPLIIHDLFVNTRIPIDLMIPTDFEMANWCTAFCLVLRSMRGGEMASSVQFALSLTCCVTRALILDILIYVPMLGPISVAPRLGLAARVLATSTIHGYQVRSCGAGTGLAHGQRCPILVQNRF